MAGEMGPIAVTASEVVVSSEKQADVGCQPGDEVWEPWLVIVGI